MKIKKLQQNRPMTAVAITTLALVLGSHAAQATIVWDQGFETDTVGWFDSDDFAGYGDATRVVSGTGGITSATGTHHAEFSEIGTGPFTRFDMYRDVWPAGGYTASIDIYLDTTWDAGSGFDYSVASNGSDGNHQRDFIWHVTKDTSTGDLLVGGSNNTNFAPREDLDTLNNFKVIASSGWHTFQHVFRDAGDGTLAVDLNLLDSTNTLLFTETRNDPADLIPSVVGGNRYGWFTTINVDGGIAVDNHSLTLANVPEPGTLALIAGALGLVGLRRRRRS